MIGQSKFINSVDELVSAGTFPRFSIIVGPDGSGKKTMARFISSRLSQTPIEYGLGVDDIRSMIATAYKVTLPTTYIIADADKMSLAAKNALLKVTEEPPQSAYFIMTLTDLNNTLDTLKSRGTVFYMDPYSVKDIEAYYSRVYNTRDDERELVIDLCSTPGEVNTLMSMGAKDFYAFANKVVDNVAVVSGSNSFKIAKSIKLKETEEGYDLKMFWKAFMHICSNKLKEDPYKYATGVRITSKYLQDLRVTGINKQSTFDCWLLDIRKEWM